jgi:predicted kinase
VIVGGAPGTGKSTLARALGQALHLPVMHRDLVKTGIHVTHRSTDPAEQRRFSEPAFELAFDVTGALLAGGCSVVLEAAFHRENSGPPLLDLAARATTVVVWTRCGRDVALERYRARSARGERHPAHNDEAMLVEMAAPSFDETRYDPPPEVHAVGALGGIQWVDTSDLFVPSVAELAARIETLLRSPG